MAVAFCYNLGQMATVHPYRFALAGLLCLAGFSFRGVGAAELVFHAPFDGSAVAAVAKGAAEPLEAHGLAFAPGRDGQAVRLSSAAKSLLAYAEPGNLSHERGTVSLWIKGVRPDATGGEKYRMLLANRRLEPKVRHGSHSLQLWFLGTDLRADVSDDADSYLTAGGMAALLDGRWHHLAWTWEGTDMRLYADGRPLGSLSDSDSPMRRAIKLDKIGSQFSRPMAFDRFFVGGRDTGNVFDGLVDELRIYSAPLSPGEVLALAEAYGKVPRELPDYAKLCDRQGPNPYVGGPAETPGVIPAADLELVEEVKLATADDVARLRDSGRFAAVGTPSFGTLGGVGYAEPGEAKNDRFAIRFSLPQPEAPLYVFDIDYPDDKVRTADFVIQNARRNGGDYTMQVGVAAGGEYANTGRILTHRVVWWTGRPGDLALLAMTARAGAPAAVAAVRVYRVKSGRLPATKVDEPKANAEGWRRCVSLYFEDPAIGADFGVAGKVSTPEALLETIDRTVATMRFTGENLFGYPGVWYQGLIGEGYNPRSHAPDFLSAWYERFDREGDLFVVPTLNVNNMPVPHGLVTRQSMEDGSLHDSPIAIHATGKPNWGGWHSTPPNYNIAHPDVQKWILGNVDALIAQGKAHPSFKGVAFHVAWHTMLSFGKIESGYNDYCIEAFERATDVKVEVPGKPARAIDRRSRCEAVVRAGNEGASARGRAGNVSAAPRGDGNQDPLRGKAYWEWISARPDVYAKWVDWRCDVVAKFWGEVAHRLRSARSDLKLWINLYTLSSPKHPDYAKPDYATQVDREAGIDGAKLTAAAPNLILSQCVYPADPRWRGEAAFKGDTAAWLKQLNYHAEPGTYRFLDTADFPWAGQHDRYWESAVGRSVSTRGQAQKTLTCDWLRETAWRVSTINPAGVHALRHFVVPLRYHDVLGVSKGGFLIGTYGMEPHLAKFAAVFRSLPAVKMTEFFREGNVVARKAAFDGKTYGYVVNTDEQPVRVDVPGSGAFDLGPYELRRL